MDVGAIALYSQVKRIQGALETLHPLFPALFPVAPIKQHRYLLERYFHDGFLDLLLTPMQ